MRSPPQLRLPTAALREALAAPVLRVDLAWGRRASAGEGVESPCTLWRPEARRIQSPPHVPTHPCLSFSGAAFLAQVALAVRPTLWPGAVRAHSSVTRTIRANRGFLRQRSRPTSAWPCHKGRPRARPARYPGRRALRRGDKSRVPRISRIGLRFARVWLVRCARSRQPVPVAIPRTLWSCCSRILPQRQRVAHRVLRPRKLAWTPPLPSRWEGRAAPQPCPRIVALRSARLPMPGGSSALFASHSAANSSSPLGEPRSVYAV